MGRSIIINPVTGARAIDIRGVAPTTSVKLSKGELESRLRQRRSTKYIRAMTELDAGCHCQDPRAVEALIAAIQEELPEVTIEKLPIGIVSRCHLGGDYEVQPPSLRTAAGFLWLMSSNPPLRQKESPTLAATDAAFDAFVASYMKREDANDVLYAVEASRDYDPGPGLERIKAPLVAVNSADDLINPPELGILEMEIRRVPRGRAVLLPLADRTRGHGSHTVAALWKEHLVALLKDSERSPQ